MVISIPNKKQVQLVNTIMLFYKYGHDLKGYFKQLICIIIKLELTKASHLI